MNSLIIRLKNSIDVNVFEKIDKTLLGEHLFVPISIRENYLFVAISKYSNKDSISDILKTKFPHPIKFMLIGPDDLKELLLSFGIKSFEKKLDDVEDMNFQKQRDNQKLGEIFLRKNLVSEIDLNRALAESKRNHVPIGSTLFSMGLITLEQLKSVLHEQLGVDIVSTDQLTRQKDYVHVLPEEFIKSNFAIPIHSDGKTLLLGVVKPLKPDLLKQIIYLTGQNPKQVLMTHYEFQNSVDTFFSRQARETQNIMDQLKQETQDSDIGDDLQTQLDNELQDASGAVSKFVNQIIINGIDSKSSDIHIEPRLSGYVVRYRKDGILKKAFDIPNKVETLIIARFKVLAKMNIAENRRPQDGTFTINYKDCSYDFRINTLPVSGREKVVIRILAPAVSLSSSDREINLIGASEDDINKVKRMVSSPNGIILTSGPTGSGKTTTLYSILKSLNDEGVNITTIEDPIEIKLEGINQSQINPKAGITFASCMRAILRQDPDIILIGEIRDYETLEIAISAALTGHLVLSTVHTNSAAATVTRLIEMGAKDYLVSSTLSGVVAQRLVRKLCDDCKQEYFMTREEALTITNDLAEIEKLISTPIYKANVGGCDKCDYQGYKGRIGLYEIMQITKEIKRLIAVGAHDLEIEETAVSSGMVTLHVSCLNHILAGNTSVSEFIRVLGMVGDD